MVSMDAGPLRLVGVSGIQIVADLEPLHGRLPQAASGPLQHGLAPPPWRPRPRRRRPLPSRTTRPPPSRAHPTTPPPRATPPPCAQSRPHAARLGGPRAPDNAPGESRAPRRRLRAPCRHRAHGIGFVGAAPSSSVRLRCASTSVLFTHHGAVCASRCGAALVGGWRGEPFRVEGADLGWG